MEEQLISQIYSGERIEEAMFDAAFLAAVTPGQIKAIAADLRQQLGPMTGLTGEDGEYRLSTQTHVMTVRIGLDANGRISMLLFEPPQQATASVAETLAAMESLPGTVSTLVVRNGETLHGHNAELPLDVGSAFKLGVLAAIKSQIEAGTLNWNTVAELKAGDKSLPSGQLQDWPDGAPVTIHTAAALMISQSDNTATDLLMRVVGRDAVEEALQISPVLTTRELFILRSDEVLRRRFERGEAVLSDLAEIPLPEVGSVSGILPSVGWPLSADRLCAVIEDVADLDVARINPGVADPDDWASIAYKGGSIDGVLNLTHHLISEDGDQYCVVVTVNDGNPIATQDVFGLVSRLLSQLASGGEP